MATDRSNWRAGRGQWQPGHGASLLDGRCALLNSVDVHPTTPYKIKSFSFLGPPPQLNIRQLMWSHPPPHIFFFFFLVWGLMATSII